MGETVLDRRRWATADILENGLVAAFTVFFALPLGSVISRPQWAGPVEYTVAALQVPISVVAAMILTWRVLGRETVTVDDDALSIRYGIGSLARTRRIPLADIESVSVPALRRQDVQNNVFGVGHRAILLECSRQRIRIGCALREEEGEAIAQRIRANLEAGRRRTRGCS